MQPPESLLARTYRLLDGLNLTYREIAEGAQVDKNWVAKFVQRAIEEPGVTKVQRVHDFLAGRIAELQVQASSDPNHSQSLGNAGNG